MKIDLNDTYFFATRSASQKDTNKDMANNISETPDKIEDVSKPYVVALKLKDVLAGYVSNIWFKTRFRRQQIIKELLKTDEGVDFIS